MNTETIRRTKVIADFLGWESYPDGETYKFPNLYPYFNIDEPENTGWMSEQISNALFHTDWAWMGKVYDIITNLENGLWDIEITYPRISIVDYKCGEQRYEYDRTSEETTNELLFNALSHYIGLSMFKIN